MHAIRRRADYNAAGLIARKPTIDALTPSLDAHGIKLAMTDEEFATMKRLAEAAEPVGIERFTRMAKKAGREAVAAPCWEPNRRCARH